MNTLKLKQLRNTTIILKEEQLNILKQINKNKIILNCFTGFGKTIISLFFTTFFKNILILVPLKIIYEQWKTAINNYNLENIQLHMLTSFLKNINKHEVNYNLIIIDECHLKIKQINEILKYIKVDFILKLTATINNDDDIRNYQIIKNYAHKKFTVYPIFLSYESITLYSKYRYRNNKPEIDYNKMLYILINNINRLDTIIEYIINIKNIKNAKTLIFCKNISTLNYLKNKLIENFKLNICYSNVKIFNDEFNMLLATYSKLGTGYDSNWFDNIIFIDNIKDIRQPLGRLRNSNFTVYDFIDHHNVFKNHYLIRKKYYIACGGQVK